MRPSNSCLLASALLAAFAGMARAEDAAAVNARQVAGLFMQSCLQFAGDRDGLRAWAKRTGLKELTADAKEAFLYGLPGVVYDASNLTGKFVLVSEDGGSCSTMAEFAGGAEVIGDLEQDLRDARIAFKVTGEKDDKEEKLLHHREYTATQGSRDWLLLISTVKDAAGGQAMLTLNPS